MITVRNFAFAAGLIYLIVGLYGFYTPVMGANEMTHPTTPLAVEAGYGHLFGLFPVNIFHNLFHVLIGFWGLAVMRLWHASRVFAKSIAVIYGVLAVMGLFPVLNTFFGMIPLYSHDIWLHGLTAAAAAYFGWAKAPNRHAAAHS